MGVAVISVGVGAVVFNPALAPVALWLSAGDTALSITQWIAGSVAGESAHVRAGAVGTVLGVISLGTWGSVGARGLEVSSIRSGAEPSERIAAGFGLSADMFRWVLSAMVESDG